jgi:hypothetical protein
MPRYFFHMMNRDQVMDSDGTELPNLEAARKHAEAVARELMYRRSGMLEQDWADWRMSVRDESSRELLSLPLGALKPTKGDGN